MKKSLVVGIAGLLTLSGIFTATAAPRPIRWARSINLPQVEHEKTFMAQDKRANFTFFSGVQDIRVEDGALTFTLAGPQATLGWGNYMGRQPVAEIADLWEERNDVVLDLTQSGAKSDWTLCYWVDGAKMNQGKTVSATFTGPAAMLRFPSMLTAPVPDGLELTVKGSKGDRFEIRSVTLVQQRSEGYVRKEFVLPEGKIWRAVAEVGAQPEYRWFGRNKIVQRLFINGKEVRRRGTRHLYDAAPVDIAPYLKPGRNCVGFRGYRVGPSGHWPFLFMQARIVMDSGQTVGIQTDAEWTYSPEARPGWNTVGFDDTGWGSDYRLGMTPQNDPSGLETCRVLVLKNPTRKDLFFRDDREVRLELHVPTPFSAGRPAVEAALSRTDPQGQSTPFKEAKITAFRKRGETLVYDIDMGRQPRGVYTISARLVDEGSIIDELPPEPLVVLRKLNQKQIEGRNYLEGLETELEDTIDFTDPADPHPWIEAVQAGRGQPARAVTEATVVTSNGLTYREAPWYFSYRFEFKHPGSFYLLEMEYPDDAYREVAVSISTKLEEMWSNSQSGVGYETGGKLYKTGTMQTLRWIHVADPGVHSIDVFTVLKDAAAAACKFRIFRIKGDLPAVAAGTGRLHGIHTERCYDTSGIGMNFGIGQHKTREQREAEKKAYTPLQRRVRYLRFLQDTTERYTQYLRFAGQNTILMGVYQYCEDNTPFQHPYEYDTAAIIPSMKTVLANTLDLNGLSFYAGVEWSQTRHVSLPTFANNAQVAKGAESYWMVDQDGRQRYGIHHSGTPPNWTHPAVPGLLKDVLSEVAEKFGHLDAFRGAHMFIVATPESGYYPPLLAKNKETPFAHTYDDATFGRFEKDTGLQLPIEKTDPKRFSKRASVVQTTSIRERFVTWRCEQFKDFMEAGLSGLRQERADAELLAVLGGDDKHFFKHWLESGRDYTDLLRDFAVDLELLNGVEGLGVGRWTISWRDNRAVQTPWYWLPKTDPRITSAYNTGHRRYVLARTSWHEGAIAAPGHTTRHRGAATLADSDWIMDWTRTRTLPQPSATHARETLIQGLIASDANALIYGFTDLNINVGREQEIREVMSIATHLPEDKFIPVLDTGFETNLAIRRLVKNDKTFLYIANPGYWHVRGELSLHTPGRVSALVSRRPLSLRERGEHVVLPVSLDPHGLVAFVSNSPDLKVVSYTTESIAPREQAHMDTIVARVQALIDDPRIRLALSLEDRQYMTDTLARVRAALAEGLYAQAWSLLTDVFFWSCWQDFLEKAAQGLAFLPPGTDKETEVKKNAAAERVLTAVRDFRPGGQWICELAHQSAPCRPQQHGQPQLVVFPRRALRLPQYG